MSNECSLTKPLPRLIRFVQIPVIVDGLRAVAILDPVHNLLRVDRGLYDRLTPMQQDQVIKTRQTLYAD